MAEVTCPTLEHILNSDQCTENLAGLGEVVYAGVKGDLASPMTATENKYSAPTFKPGKGLFKFECADETQGIMGGSLGYRKGFKQTLEFAIDAVNEIIAKTGRALNNLDLIVPCGSPVLWAICSYESSSNSNKITIWRNFFGKLSTAFIIIF